MNKIFVGSAENILDTLPENIVNTIVTSPPYFCQRVYGVEGELGLEKTPEEYIKKLVYIFDKAKRVLKDDGTIWVNLGDKYTGSSHGSPKRDNPELHPKKVSIYNKLCGNSTRDFIGQIYKEKDLIGIPWMFAFAMREAGWYLRQDIIWHKNNAMPESVKDRCVTSHEYIFLFSKNKKYYFDYESIMEIAKDDKCKKVRCDGSKKYVDGKCGRGHNRWTIKNGVRMRRKRSVWSVNTKPSGDEHIAPFPEQLIVPYITAGCPEKGIVMDIFGGRGTTAIVSKKLNRNYILIEINPESAKLAENNIIKECGWLF